jgi:hypothetical protein
MVVTFDGPDDPRPAEQQYIDDKFNIGLSFSGFPDALLIFFQ